jgi:hypothetical protein
MPEKEDKTIIKNGESRVTGNTIPEKEDKTNIYCVACDSGFSILDICFFFFLWHSVACDSEFSILDICFIFFLWHSVACPESQATQYQRKKIKQISRIENTESQATQYQRKKIK